VVGQTHLKLCVTQDNSMAVEGIAFGMAEHYPRIAKGEPFKMCYSIEENEYRGTVSLQVRVRDIRFD
jgi:single-stranded-DNA-specific exonuclease